jgi:regulation of enolase protein 1 (concanavalin A-like superfamily)
MIACERTNKLRPLPCCRKVGRTMSQIVALFSIGIILLLGGGNAHAADPLAITAPPAGVQTKWPSTYVSTKYLKIDKYNIHILGSPTVSDWFMRESYGLISNMIGAMKNPEDRAKFSGFQALLITDADPDLTFLGSLVGHRNTGDNGWSLFNEALVCAKAVDTLYPDLPAAYRGWETPVHEFGHAVELTLGLTAKTLSVRVANGASINGASGSESYAWATERWFSVRPGSSRSNFSAWEYNYMASVFNANNTWTASFEPRPVNPPTSPSIITVDKLPEGYVDCGAEGFQKVFLVETDVAYGTDGKFVIKTQRKGTVAFDNAFFGDPAVGIAKRGYYKLPTTAPGTQLTVTVDKLPEGYVDCGAEGFQKIFLVETDVAYGAAGKFFIKTQQKGSITFNNAFFGDPADGVIKRGYYKLPTITPGTQLTLTVDKLPEGYVDCGAEGFQKIFLVETDVAYGAAGRFFIKTQQKGTITFNNAFFGDPADGVVKRGYYKLPTTTPGTQLTLTVDKLPEGYVDCGAEGFQKIFSVETDVAYGAAGKFFIKTQRKGNVTFNNAFFGDPAEGVVKRGYYKLPSNVSARSSVAQIAASAATKLPLPWTSGNIGSSTLTGASTYNIGTISQAGSGALGVISDKLSFSSQTLSGDGEITAKINTLQDTGTLSGVGVMIRETLAPNSKHVFMGMTGKNTYVTANRITTGGISTTGTVGIGKVPNTWVRLVRVGNVITASKSIDGSKWTTVSSTTLTMAANCYIGLAVSSGSDATLNNSKFSSISVTP